jgi:2-C-methyl-D-erythritol 4-phosphate cytidylyltransferase
MEDQVKTKPRRRVSPAVKAVGKPGQPAGQVSANTADPQPQPSTSADQAAQPVFAIIPAAGSGSRMNLGQNKQFLLLGRYPVIIRTLRVFEAHPAISGYVVIATPGEEGAMRRLLADHGLKKCLAVALGGATRQLSVLHGLAALAANWPGNQAALSGCQVLVHDGARCFVTPEIIDRVINGIRQFQACGAAVLVKDTVKLADKNGQVVKTLDRSLLWAMQTPQGSTYGTLRAAYDLAVSHKWQATDDLAVLEMAGLPVHLVSGDERNIKLTTPTDRLLAEQLASLADQAESAAAASQETIQE